MKSIGGYFEIELDEREEFHKNAIGLNTGRNALEYILCAKKYKKIFIPFYTCDVLLEPIKKLNLPYEFYSINHDFEPVFDFKSLDSDEAFLYTNYFGLKEEYINRIANFQNLIIDNAQAFYSRPVEGIDTFYSPRKFFGVPDGAYLYTSTHLETEIEEGTSFERFDHLLMRTDKNAEFGYSTFNENEKTLANNPIKKMSRLTQKLMTSIPYEEIAKKRINNFYYLHSVLKNVNQINISEIVGQVPMTYPLLLEDDNLRGELIRKKIYTPHYWPNVLDWAPNKSLEYKLSKKMVFLPIDQRYTKKDMNRILEALSI